ncbi:MAG: hypothetical protein NTX86_04655 [Candidatus Dependentiae bacterium]|nr:hypothetical protein [Candidatus Dependentiae bacterium]
MISILNRYKKSITLALLVAMTSAPVQAWEWSSLTKPITSLWKSAQEHPVAAMTGGVALMGAAALWKLIQQPSTLSLEKVKKFVKETSWSDIGQGAMTTIGTVTSFVGLLAAYKKIIIPGVVSASKAVCNTIKPHASALYKKIQDNPKPMLLMGGIFATSLCLQRHALNKQRKNCQQEIINNTRLRNELAQKEHDKQSRLKEFHEENKELLKKNAALETKLLRSKEKNKILTQEIRNNLSPAQKDITELIAELKEKMRQLKSNSATLSQQNLINQALRLKTECDIHIQTLYIHGHHNWALHTQELLNLNEGLDALLKNISEANEKKAAESKGDNDDDYYQELTTGDLTEEDIAAMRSH